MKKYLLVLLILSVTAVACTTDDVIVEEVTGRIFEDRGVMGVSLCGWLVEINGEIYQPSYLNSQYRQEDFQVFMSVEFLQEAADCGIAQHALRKVRIEQIRPAGN